MTSVTGTLGTMSVPDLLQWLLTGGKTGVLTVVREGIEKRLYFREGAIVGASSSDPDFAFGQFLLDLGKIDEPGLVELVKRQRETGIKMGRLLVSDGRLTSAEVTEVLQLKARETLFELMAWREGDFDFDERSVEMGDQVPLSLPIDRVIFEGIRKVEERRSVREAFPSGNAVPAILSDESKAEMLADPSTSEMVAHIDAGRSLREIARAVRSTVMAVSEALYPYLETGHLVVGSSEDPRVPSYYLPSELAAEIASAPQEGTLGPLSPDRLAELALNFLAGEQYEDAMATIEYAEQIAHGQPVLGEARMRVEEALRGNLWQYFGGGVTVPVLTVGIRDLPLVKPMLTSQEAFVATRVSGADSVKEIVDLSPLPELTTLRILRTFAEAELVIFR